MKTAFVDCGGYDGRTVRRLTKPYDKIYVFEPDANMSSFYADLNVELIAKAAWVYDGSVDFYLGDNTQGSSVCKSKITGKLSDTPIRVPCIDLSNWLAQLITEYDVTLKLNVEGAEYGILRKMLRDGVFVKRLIVAFHWDKIGMPEKVHLDLLDQLKTVEIWGPHVDV